ncbi:PTS sugar transporter subunit IIA, partial [Pseudomonas aeruginosa]
LLLAGRCRYPRKLEADLWAREAVFSTGLGFSFAIPHSKSEHIEQSTISVARLAQPVAWGADAVQFVIMLTLNRHSAGDPHMRIFSRLARRIMHAEFRQSLVTAQSSEAIAALLQRELELPFASPVALRLPGLQRPQTVGRVSAAPPGNSSTEP